MYHVLTSDFFLLISAKRARYMLVLLKKIKILMYSI